MNTQLLQSVRKCEDCNHEIDVGKYGTRKFCDTCRKARRSQTTLKIYHKEHYKKSTNPYATPRKKTKRVCRWCGKEFIAHLNNQRYCVRTHQRRFKERVWNIKVSIKTLENRVRSDQYKIAKLGLELQALQVTK